MAKTFKPKPLTEKEITIQIRYVLKLYGVFHWKVFQTLGSTVGVPDIIAIQKGTGKLIGIEIKTARGKVSTAQQYFIDLINANGGIAFVARSAMDVINTLGLRPGSNQ